MNAKVTPMHRSLLLTLTISLAVAALAGCGGSEPLPTRAERAPVAAPVSVAQVESVTDAIVATGTAEAYRRVMPGTKIMGRIEQVLVREGDRVAKGATLARLESRDLAAMVEQAKAGVAMAEAQLENARAQHARILDLHSRGSVTEKNKEDAEAGFRTATAAVEQARANLRAAEVTLSYAAITTPVAGHVVERRTEAGDMAAPGMPLFAIEDLSRVKIIAKVSESEIAGLETGGAAKVAIEALDFERDATVAKIVAAADRASRTFEVELLVDNDDGRIKSGMFARVSFARGVRSGLFVPESALVQRGQLDGVFAVDEQQRALLRWVRLGQKAADGRVEVISGLGAGERYVVAPPAGLEDGVPVEAR